jgi:sugar lactone lactonase YvrE
LVRFAPNGSVDCEVALPVSNPTSCCFGGADLHTLFVTSARFMLGREQLRTYPREGSLVVLRSEVAGTPTACFTG